MRKRGTVFFLLLIFFFLFEVASAMEGSFIPPLNVLGDVPYPLILTDLSGFELQRVVYRSREVYGVPIPVVLQRAGLTKGEFSLLYVARELASKIDSTYLEESYLAFSVENGWEVLNLTHPISSNVKRLEEILVIAPDFDFHFGVFTPAENLASYSVGELHMLFSRTKLDLSGVASVDSSNGVLTSTVYTRKKGFLLQDIVENTPDRRTFLIRENGEMHRYEEGYFVLESHRVDFYLKNRQAVLEHIKGVVFDAPVTHNTDTFHDALHYLTDDQPVLVVILDGLGYHQYTYAVRNGYLPFVSSLGEAKPALTVYRPVTNAGVAAILTGVGPEKNGVRSRRERTIQVLDIFSQAKRLGKESSYIIGDRQIIQLAIEPLFNLDRNENGSTDDEIMLTAISEVQKDRSLVVVHLKDIDKAGHTYGPFDPYTMAVIEETDKNLERLLSLWEGIVILVSDHGMHATKEGGNHGTLRFEDMVVPYLLVRTNRNP